jgi:S-adenosylmethionine synthetase
MPAPIFYANKILQSINLAIKDKKLTGLGPDAKSQVTLIYQNGKPIKTKSIVVSIQHSKNYSQKEVKNLIRSYVEEAFPNKSWMCEEEEFYVNPTGSFIIGGPESDSGLTGRKIIVDTYGGAAPHGGGAFSGKDPSKVDRSAAYMARYIAKNVVASGIAKKCTIQISYAIGVSHPLSFYVNTHRTGIIDEIILAKYLQEIVDLSPSGIKSHLDLKRPIYQKTASYGHFGRSPLEDGSFSWEKLDLVTKLKSLK